MPTCLWTRQFQQRFHHGYHQQKKRSRRGLQPPPRMLQKNGSAAKLRESRHRCHRVPATPWCPWPVAATVASDIPSPTATSSQGWPW